MATQFDDFDAQLQCEDVQGDYIPTEQDLLDMEVAFALDPMEVVAQFEAIVQELKTLTSKYISFIDISYDEYKSYNSDEIKPCLNNIKCKDKFFCEYDEENKICRLKIPKINFFTNTSNQQNYYERIADELIRYNRIRDFIFSQRSFLNFSNNKYNLNPNELLIIESKLNDDFFNNLIPINMYNTDIIPYDMVNPSNLRKNKLFKELSYNDFESTQAPLPTKFIETKETQLKQLLDTTIQQEKNKNKTQLTQPKSPIQPIQPIQLTQPKQSSQPIQQKRVVILTKNKTKLIDDTYPDNVDITKKQSQQLPSAQSAPGDVVSGNFIDCTNEIELKSYRYFNEPMNCKEFNIINSVLCSYQLIIEVINTNNTTTLNLKNIITNLIKKYNELFENKTYKKTILSLWNNEGKEDISNLLANNEVNVDDIITVDTYFITTTDIMLLSDIYKIPIVLFSDDEFIESNTKIESLNIYFIMNKEKSIKLLTAPKKTTRVPINANKKYYYIYVFKNNGKLNYKLFSNNLDEFKLSETIVADDFINAINASNSYINTILS